MHVMHLTGNLAKLVLALRITQWRSEVAKYKYGSIAQSVEQRTENPRVAGSIPARATKNLAFARFFCILG